jgi:hypothetical protein
MPEANHSLELMSRSSYARAMPRLARAIVVALLVLLSLAPLAQAHVLRLSFVRTRSGALVRAVVARQHASGGKITTCYRVSNHAARCGFKTWKTGRIHWTCQGHIDAFFAPATSNRVSVLSRGAVCR